MLYPDTVAFGMGSIFIGVALAPFCYLLWLLYCSAILILRFFIFGMPIKELLIVLGFYTATVELLAVHGLYIVTMWLFTKLSMINHMLKLIINSTLALEAWGLLGIIAAIIAGNIALLLNAYLSILYYSDENLLNTIQDKGQYFKKMFLCSITVILTVIIMYLF